MPTQPLTTILPLLDSFDAFILDQWGVLHDGTAAFPWALEAVEGLLDAGKVIVTLSNSGRREATTRQQMRTMGLPVERFRANVTSGEAAVTGLRERRINGQPLPGDACYLLCRQGDRSVIADTGIVEVDDPAAADFVLLSGIDGETRSLDDYLAELDPAAARGLPVVCTNPDLVAVSAAGNVLAPGGVAMAYAERAGVEPLFVGKPHPLVYALCRRALPDVAGPRIVAVGDSLEHDIAGAARAGFKTVFCLDGIHANVFEPSAPIKDSIDQVERLATQHDAAVPDFAIARLSWW